MKLRILSLSLLALCLIAVPAMAQTVYSNGPINGTLDAWTINFGFVVSDTFATNGGLVNGLSFGVWADPGDVLLHVEVQITSAEDGGTLFSDQVVNITQSGCSGNQYAFNVCTETGSLSPVNLAAGTYWINLDNAVTEAGRSDLLGRERRPVFGLPDLGWNNPFGIVHRLGRHDHWRHFGT